jgi:hypothetical protein
VHYFEGTKRPATFKGMQHAAATLNRRTLRASSTATIRTYTLLGLLSLWKIIRKVPTGRRASLAPRLCSSYRTARCIGLNDFRSHARAREREDHRRSARLPREHLQRSHHHQGDAQCCVVRPLGSRTVPPPSHAAMIQEVPLKKYTRGVVACFLKSVRTQENKAN